MSRKLAYVQAFNEAVRQEMAADPDVFCAGEDVGAFGGRPKLWSRCRTCSVDNDAAVSAISSDSMVDMATSC